MCSFLLCRLVGLSRCVYFYYVLFAGCYSSRSSIVLHSLFPILIRIISVQLNFVTVLTVVVFQSGGDNSQVLIKTRGTFNHFIYTYLFRLVCF